MSRRLLGLLAAAATVSVGLASASECDGDAHAAAGSSAAVVTATVSTRTLRSTGNRSFDLYLHVQNPGEAQTTDIEVGGHAWPGPPTIGGPLSFGLPSMQGPGTVMLVPAPVPPLGREACVRGVAYDFTLLSVDVPAQSSTTVKLPVRAIVPAWPGTDYTPRVSLNFDGRPLIPVNVAPVRMTGPTGFRIALTTRPSPAAVRAGRPLTIAGSTSPAVRHAIVRVSIRSAAIGKRQTPGPKRLLGTARTDGNGSFRLRTLTAPAVGDYRLLATIADPGGRLMHDSTCPITLYVNRRR